MKKIKYLMTFTLFLFTLMLFSLTAYGKVNIDNVDLKGDSNFIAKIKNLDTEAPEKVLYVSATGNDSNDGTINSPYKTINTALDNATAGTTVYVRSGSYAENIYFPNNGKEGSYITLKNYPNEYPKIIGTNKNDIPMIELDGHDYIHIEGFELCDYSARWCYGILFAGGENHVIIRNNTIHNIKCSKPNDPDNSGANGILLFGETEEPISNVYIGDNYIYDLQTGWCEALSVTANCEYVNVINNKIDSSTNIGIDFYGNNTDGYCPVESLNQPRFCIAAGNEVSNCVCDYATCYGLYVDGARDIVLENNISYNNQGGIEIGSEERNENYPVKNITVRNNLIYNNSENGITVGGWNDGSSGSDPLSGVVYDTTIYNNTVVNNASTGAGQLHIAMVDNIDIRNNIFYSDTTKPLVASDVSTATIKNLNFKNNLYFSSKNTENNVNFELNESSQTGMTDWKTLTGENGYYGNPLFTALNSNDYTIGENSPAVNTGDNSIFSGLYDLLNNNRIIDTIDIGAYEYQNGTVIIPTTESTTKTSTSTESSSETTTLTEITTESTTISAGTNKVWNFSDSIFSSYVGRVNATIDGLDIYKPASAITDGSGGTLDNIVFTKNIKLNKISALSASDLKNAFGTNLKAGATITVYYSDNGAGGIISIADNNLNKIASSETGIDKSFKKCQFTIPKDGYYYIYAAGTVNSYVYGISVSNPKTTADAATALKVIAGITIVEDITQYDFNNDGNVNLLDIIAYLK